MFTPEQYAKAKTAKSAEELFAYAKENGAPMNENEAKVFFEQWHKEGELADEELDKVAGGFGFNDKEAEEPLGDMKPFDAGDAGDSNKDHNVLDQRDDMAMDLRFSCDKLPG